MLTIPVAAHTFLSLRASISPLLFKLLSTSRCIPCKPPYTLLSDPPTCVSSTTGMKPTYLDTLDIEQWTEGEQGGKLHLLVLMGINYPMPRRRPFRGCAG